VNRGRDKVSPHLRGKEEERGREGERGESDTDEGGGGGRERKGLDR
jgi:hypothetical protein